MRNKTILVLLIISLISFNSISNVDAAGIYRTVTVFDPVSDMNEGDIISLTTTTNSEGSPVMWGDITYLEVESTLQVGSSFNPGSYSGTDIKFIYTPTTDTTINALRIPFLGFQSDASLLYIELIILEDGSKIVRGQVDKELISQSLSEGFLLYVLGTGVMSQAFTSITMLSTKTYEFQVHANIDLEITVPMATTTSDISMFDGTTNLGSSKLVFLQGTNLGKVSTVDGLTSMSYTVPLGSTSIITYFFASANYYNPSYDEISFSTPGPDLVVNIADIEGITGETIDISASVYYATVGVSLLDVSFYMTGTTKIFMGTATTDIFGVVTMSYEIVDGEGSYSYSAEVVYSSQFASSSAILTVYPPSGYISTLTASGIYLQGGTTTVDIQGKLLTDNGNPVSSHDLELYLDDIYETILTTGGDGSFSYQFTPSLTPSTYISYITAKNPNPSWTIPDRSSDLIINKGAQFITLPALLSTEYLDQPILLEGSIVDEISNPVETTVQLFEEIAGDYTGVDVTTSDVLGEFSFSLDNYDVGTHNFKVVAFTTTDYNSETIFSQLIVGKSTVYLSRGGLGMEYIDFKQAGNFAVVLQDGLGKPIDGVTLSYAFDTYATPNVFTHEFDLVTSATGWATTSHVPVDGQIYLEYDYKVEVTVLDTQYNDLSFIFQYRVLPVDIIFTPPVIETMVGSQITMDIDLLDEHGELVDNVLFLVIERGNTDTVYSVNSLLSYDLMFDSVGIYTITITHIDSASPYNYLNVNFDVTVNIGHYYVAAFDMNADQGETIIFPAAISSNAAPAENSILASLFIYDNGWILLGSDISDNNGDISVSADITNTPGIYQFKWETDENINYQMGVYLGNLIIEKAITQIFITGLADYPYGSPPAVTATLSIPLVGPVVAKNVIVSFAGLNYSLITDTQGMVYFTPPSDTPSGVYSLTVYLAGDTTHKKSSISQNVEVISTVTHTTIIESYPITFYGMWSNVTVLLTDDIGVPITGEQIEVEIDGEIYLGITDENGYAFIEFYLKLPDGSYQLTTRISDTTGWQYSEDTLLIIHQKRQLGMDITMDSSMVYSSLIDILIHVNSDLETSMGNIDVQLLLLNGGQWDHFATFTTDSNGDIVLNSYQLPDLRANYQHSIRFQVQHPDYYDGMTDRQLNVDPMPITVVTSNSVINKLGTISSFRITVVDTMGNPIFNISVYAQIVDVQVVWSDTFFTDSNGIVFVEYLSPIAGNIMVQYFVSDELGNYVSVVDQISVSIPKVGSYIDYTIIDNAAELTMQIKLYNADVNTLAPGTNHIEVYTMQGSWVLYSNVALIDGVGSVIIDFNGDTNYKLVFTGTGDLDPSELIDDFIYRNLVLTDITYTNIFPLLSYMVDTNLPDGYVIDYILGAVPGTVIVINGSIDINLLLDRVGDHTLYIDFKTQGWYNGYNWVEIVEIIAATPQVEISSELIFFGPTTSLTATVYSTVLGEYYYFDVSASLYIMIDGWELVASNSSVNGILTFSSDFNYTMGEHSFRILLYPSPVTADTEVYFSTHIIRESKIFGSVGQGVYTDGGEVLIQLLDTDNFQAIPNQLVSLFITIGTEEVLADTGYTNSTGFVILFIDGKYEPGTYLLRVEHTISGSYGSEEIDLSYLVVKEKISIDVFVEDMGISNGYEVTVQLSDESGTISSGEIFWSVDTYFGSFKYNSQETIFVIELPGDLIGDFIFSLEYLDNQGLFMADPVEIEIGYEKVESPDATLIIAEISYGLDLEIFISHEGLGLANTTVMINFINTQYALNADNEGMLRIDLNFLEHGNYSITITVLKNKYIANQLIFELEFEVVVGYTEFEIYLPKTYYYSDPLNITIDDIIVNSTYSVIISNDFISTSYDNLTRLDFLSLDIPVGNYTVLVTRHNPMVLNTTAAGNLTIVPKELIITMTSSVVEGDLILDFSIWNDGVPVKLGLEVYLLVMMDGEIILEILELWDNFPFYKLSPRSGTLDILFELRDNYYGSYEIDLAYDSPIDGAGDDGEDSGLGLGILVPVGLFGAVAPIAGKGINILRRRRQGRVGEGWTPDQA